MKQIQPASQPGAHESSSQVVQSNTGFSKRNPKRRTLQVLAGLLAVLLLLGGLVHLARAGQGPGSTFTVNSTGDAPDANPGDGTCTTTVGAVNCTLRAAIQEANASPGSTITFNIPGGGVQTISPATNLPTITAAGTVIDGATQPGFTAGGAPLIALDGTNTNGAGSGLIVTTSATINALNINNFGGNIGGVTGNGILLSGGGGSVVTGCYIGTDATGNVAASNDIGIDITNASTNNLIGGTSAAARNVISANSQNILIEGAGTNGNIVKGNYIGPKAAGTGFFARLYSKGLTIQGGAQNNVIGDGAGGRNIISGSGFANIYIGDAFVRGGGANTVGNVVQGNYVGLDATGTRALGNGGIGPGQGGGLGILIVIADVNTTAGNTIGGPGPLGNVISGNPSAGIVVAASFNDRIQGNLIGTDPSGTFAIPNLYGVSYDSGSQGTLGGTGAGEGNLIAGNTRQGVEIGFSFNRGLPNGTRVSVYGNKIGTDVAGASALPNGSGINLDAAFAPGNSNNTIGGTAAGQANLIAFNTGDGILIDRQPIVTGNRILGNSIHDNGGLGIQFGDPGAAPIPNDPGDADTGSNNQQNYPVITGGTNGTNSVITGTFNSTPSPVGGAPQTFTLDFYSNDAVGPSGYVEGQTYLGSKSVTTDANGDATFTFTATGVNLTGKFASATATNAAGDTSEFSQTVAAGAQTFAFSNNLIINPGAEAGAGSPTGDVVPVPAWTPGGQFTAVQYGANGGFPASSDPGPANRGVNFFSGGQFTALSTGTQTIDVSPGAAPIDAGTVTFDLSGFLGGYDGQDDNAVLSLTFQNGGGGSLGTAQIGPVLSADRNGQTGLLARATSGAVPAGTRSIFVALTLTRTAGSYDDGYADNLSLILTQGAVQPASVVTNTNGSGAGSLRDAIAFANSAPGTTITFNIPGGGVQTISPLSPLPAIRAAGTIIDGSTEPGASTNTLGTGQGTNARLLIQLSGTNAGEEGLALSGGGATVRGLIINGFSPVGGTIGGGAIVIRSANNVVEGCFLGTDSTGIAAGAGANGNFRGVLISDPGATGNLIGGTTPASRNLISGNTHLGVDLFGGANSNTIENNLIGTDATGISALPNADGGVLVNSSSSNIVGGVSAARRNVIAGNGAAGVRIDTNSSTQTATGNQVLGNFIGLGADGVTAVPNGDGVSLNSNAQSNTVGGTAAGARNVISGNTGSGVAMNASNNFVLGNFIGTDASGTGAVGNAFGVIVAGVNGLDLGDGTVAGRNVISGSSVNAVQIGQSSTNVRVRGNFVGLNAAGTGTVSNGFAGIIIQSGASGNTVGGTVAGQGNVVSGNGYGVQLDGSTIGGGSTSNNIVQGNIIGLNPAGTAILGNRNSGVFVEDNSTGNLIGGTASGARNIISGNASYGVQIDGALATGNTAQNNYCGLNAAGTSALANGADGVALLNGAHGNTIGGTAAGAGNVLSGNASSGLALRGAGTTGNQVLGNLIGTNASGAAALNGAPSANGVVITGGAQSNTVGGFASGAGNVIAGNAVAGVLLSGTNTSGNQVLGNLIGTNTTGAGVPNGLGVQISGGASSNSIGGANSGNTIAFNAGTGVQVSGASSVNNAIRFNSMHDNGGLAIDLVGGVEDSYGVTANHTGNSASGPNDLTNAPVITRVVGLNNSVTVFGTLDAAPSQSYSVDLYSSPSIDPSGYGEGATFIATQTVTTNANGHVDFTITIGSSSNARVRAAVKAPAAVKARGKAAAGVKGHTGAGLRPSFLSSSTVFYSMTASARAIETSEFSHSVALSAAALSLSVAPSIISEGDGANAARGTVTRNADTSAALTVALASSDTGKARVPASVVIPAGAAAVTFPIDAVDNNIADGTKIVTISASATGFTSDTAQLTVSNIHSPGISVGPTSGLITTKSGGTSTFSVTLNTQPTAPVSITFTSSDTTAGTVSPDTLSFTQANYNTLQTVTVRGVDDGIASGDRLYTISGAATSSDANYNGRAVPSVSVTNLDNKTPTLTLALSPTNVSESAGANAATGTLSRNTDPTNALTVALSSSDTSEARVPATVTIPAGAASVAFALEAVNNNVDNGDQLVTITASAASFPDATAQITIANDDAAGFTVTPPSSPTTTESGGTSTFTVKLNTQPRADVTVTLTSSDTTEGVVSPGILSFTSANYATPQLVTVRGVDDSIADGDKAYTVSGVAASQGADYNGRALPLVNLINLDNEKPTSQALTLSLATSTVLEGTGTTGTVQRPAAPATSLTVTISAGSGLAAPATVTIPADATSVSFNIAVPDDKIAQGTRSTTLSASATGFASSTLSVTITDNDVAGITVTPTRGLRTSEGGGTATFRVSLSSQPTSDVTIALKSSNTREGTVSPRILTFTSANFATPQRVTVRGVGDALVDAPVAYTITGQSASRDSHFNKLSLPVVHVLNLDHNVASLKLAISPRSFSEASGRRAAVGTIKRNFGLGRVLQVLVSSSNTGKVRVPRLVTIPAHATSATFLLGAVDNGLHDGAQSVVITVRSGSLSAAQAVTVIDNASARLALSARPTSFSERAGQNAAVGTVTRNTAVQSDLLVTLASSDSSRVHVPQSVRILAGQHSAAFRIEALDNGVVDASPQVSILATARGLGAARLALEVSEGDKPSLKLSLSPNTVAEGATGSNATLTRNFGLSQPLPVQLTASESTLHLPSSVTFSAGASTTTFAVSAPSSSAQGTRAASITARGGGQSTSAELQITDATAVPTPTLGPPLQSWGYNHYGQVGDGSTVDRPLVVNALAPDDAVQVAAGGSHSLALQRGGKVWAWGYNVAGQLGDGTTQARPRAVPVLSEAGSGQLSGVAQLAAGWYHSLALLPDGTVLSWGRNADGELGDGTRTARSRPVRVRGLAKVRFIAAGVDFSAAITQDGSLWAWGRNGRGQLGNGSTQSSAVPQRVLGEDGTPLSNIVSVSLGSEFALALRSDGVALAWGSNQDGQLAQNTDRQVGADVPRALQIRVVALEGSQKVPAPRWKGVAAGYVHSALLALDGRVFSCGDNYFLQLGRPAQDADGTLRAVVSGLGSSSALSGMTSISAGAGHTVALGSDGLLRAWGWNQYGTLGEGTTQNRDAPVLVHGLSAVTSFSAGYGHTLALGQKR